MRAAVADGRIGPGSIPVILQRPGLWSTVRWSAVSVPDAPAFPVWQCPGNGTVGDTTSPSIKVHAGQVLLLDGWVRAGSTIPSAGTLNALALTYNAELGNARWANLVKIPAATLTNSWRFVRTVYAITNPLVTTVSMRVSVRQDVPSGYVQMCGMRMSVIGAMPVP